MYDQAVASIQVNGALVGTMPIRCGVRQGCPMIVILYAMCLQPLLRTLEQQLSGIRIGTRERLSPVFAYADDVTIAVTRPADFEVIRTAIQTFDRATGARLNPRKSKALAIGAWTTAPTTLDIDFCDRATILGVGYGPTVAQSSRDCWDGLVRTVRAQARTAYGRQLGLAQRIQYVQQYLLAKLWFLAQIFPLARAQAQLLTTICSWYIWQGAVFRVPMTTLQLPKYRGGWGLLNIEGKCLTLLYYRLTRQAAENGTTTAALMKHVRTQ
jgi:hypothetical protein